MKTNLKIIFILASFLLLFLTGCSSADKPSEDDVKKTVIEIVPYASVDEFKIIKWGEYNKKMSHWPIKVFVGGHQFTETGPYDSKELNLDIYKDEFGDWKAEHSGIRQMLSTMKK